MQWLSGTISKVTGVLDQAQGYAAQAIVAVAEPRVKEEIDQRVTVFRDSALQALPQQCEERLRGQAQGGSPVAWVFNKVLGDNTDVLVARLVEQFRPGINDATAGLSTQATQYIMEQLKDLLDGAEAEASGGEAAPPPAGETETVPEQQSRGFNLPSFGGGDGSEAGGGFNNKALGHIASLAGMAFNVEQRLPGFESAARALVHPLFETLKVQVWELVPAALQDALGPLVGDKQDDVEANPEEAGVAGDAGGPEPAVISRGLTSWIQNKLEGKAGVVLDKVMAAALDALDGPLQALIGRMVDELESTSTQAAFTQVRQKLAEYKLISSA